MVMAVGSGHEWTNLDFLIIQLFTGPQLKHECRPQCMFSITLWFPAVPPKPAHISSPVTEVSLPLGSGNLSVKPSMEGGVEGAMGKGRVSNLISRFEESR